MRTSQGQARYKNLHKRSEISTKILELKVVLVGPATMANILQANPAVRIFSTANVRAIFVAACNWRVGIRWIAERDVAVFKGHL